MSYWRIRDCYDVDEEQRFEELDDLFDEIESEVDPEEFDDDFDDYLYDVEGEVTICGYGYSPADVLRQIDYTAYSEAICDWFSGILEDARYEAQHYDSAEVFGWTIEFVEDDEEDDEEDLMDEDIDGVVIDLITGEVGRRHPTTNIVRVFCKDPSLTPKSIYLHEIYTDKTEPEVQQIIREFNDNAIRNFIPKRLFIAPDGYHPEETQIAAGL